MGRTHVPFPYEAANHHHNSWWAHRAKREGYLWHNLIYSLYSCVNPYEQPYEMQHSLSRKGTIVLTSASLRVCWGVRPFKRADQSSDCLCMCLVKRPWFNDKRIHILSAWKNKITQKLLAQLKYFNKARIRSAT